ncbi:MAG: FAD-dependent thymidylate synthase [Synergistaceae bacterium]
MSIFVKLIAHTPESAKIVSAAARLCYSPTGVVDILDSLTEDKIKDFLNKLNETGHLSPFEHVSFTFAIEGISRVATHQLVRHRLASYSQQSQRYVGVSDDTCICPPSILKNEKAKNIFDEQVQNAWDSYNRLIESGIPKEDARFILPHGAETRIVLTMNARELHHFFALRLCRRAQWEIKELARQMLILARDVAPEIFAIAGPSCLVDGKCKEFHSCGRPYSNITELLSE